MSDYAVLVINEYISKYYFIDWLAFAFAVGHMYLIGHKIKQGWLLGIATNLAFIVVGFMMQSAAGIIMNMCFLVLNVYNYRLWTKE